MPAKDRGCSRPGCTVPGYQCQAHHVADWAKGGLTDIDDLTLACGKDNRLVTENDWRTRKRKETQPRCDAKPQVAAV